MMVENVLYAEDLEWQRYKKDVVRWVASLDNMESMAQVYPPSIDTFPKESPTIFPEITGDPAALIGHHVPIDTNTVENFERLFRSLTTRAQYSDLITIALQHKCFFPDTTVKWNRKIFDDDQYFSSHG